MSIIIDTGIFYALYDRKDVNHLNSVAILLHILSNRYGRAYTTDYVVLESTILLGNMIGKEQAFAFLDFLDRAKIRVIIVDEKLYSESLNLMKKEAGRLSLCDSAILTVMKELDIEYLASYDERSFSRFGIEVLGKGYFDSLRDGEKEEVMKMTGN